MEHFDQYSQQFHQHEYNSHLRNDKNFFNDGLQIDNLQNRKPVNVVVESSGKYNDKFKRNHKPLILFKYKCLFK